MSSVCRRTARRICKAFALAGLSAALTVSSASAAPSLDVAMRSDANEIQAVYVEATTGQFKLCFEGECTGDLSATATAPEVQAALNALSKVKTPSEQGSVGVRKATISDTNGTNPFLVTFDGGPLGMRLQPLLTARQGTLPLGASPLGGGPAMAYVATRQPGGISRSDERIDYTVEVKNSASANPAVGDVLTCDANDPASPARWFPAAPNHPTFTFEWLSNGFPASGPVSNPTPTTSTYVVQAADAGRAVQCRVLGTNGGGASASFANPLTIAPLASPAPPVFGTSNNRPTISPLGNSTASRTCVLPTGWSGATDWEYQWLRNGQPIPGATNPTYQPTTAPGEPTVPGGEDQFKILQCQVTGKSGSGGLPATGAAIAISANFATSAPASFPGGTPPNNGTGEFRPFVPFSNETSGPVTAEVELPAGLESKVYLPATGGTGWTCSAQLPAGVQPAKAVCTNSEVKTPGQSYSPLNVAMGLGADAPEAPEVKAIVSGGGASSSATAEDSFSFGPARAFGFIPGRFSARALDEMGEDYTQAGGHPSLAVSNISLVRNRRLTGAIAFPGGKMKPAAPLRSASGDIPPGFVGNPVAVPELCQDTEAMLESKCPPGSVVGELAITTPSLGTQDGIAHKRMALYAMEPELGAPAQFGAVESFNRAVYVVTPRLRPEDGYAISIDAEGIVEDPVLLDVRVTLCGYGANTIFSGAEFFRSCKEKDDPGAYIKPFLTSQTECASSGPETKMTIDSWAEPGAKVSATAISPKMTGCELVPFEPELDLQPTTKTAESASGLNVDLAVPTDGFEDPDGLAQAHLKKTIVTLPAGMTVNPSSADGLEACTQAQLGMVNGVPNNEPVNCPDASKVGTAIAKTPILEEPLEGGIYLAKQQENPFGTLVAVYVVVESKERGVIVKLPGKVEFKANGQIVSTFDDNPQAPVSSLELSFDSGPRAALMTPQRCGSYQIVSELTPWSAADPDNPTPAETVKQTSSFDVTSGPGGGACPTGALEPAMKAGISTPVAGASSPFVFSLSRNDGTQRFNGLSVTLPPGLAANLSGVPYCSNATLASIPSALGTGAAEVAKPACPAASRVGSVSVAAGTGNPFWVNTGSAYLAGPYKGAPLSLAVVIPAVAGPFDLGNVVVRNAVVVDPRTAQVSIKSDPLPTQLHNLPVDVRSVRVTVDRPGFMQAPTNCEEMRIDAVVSGEEGGSAPLSNRFQVGECGSLEFGPKLKLEYKGQTKRTGNPALRAVLTQPGGQANIANTQVILPKGSFIDNAHINNPCTRAQYAANACPAKSILGTATAWSPLLDEPLSGNVYFRSNGGERELPDIVAKLQGQVEVELVGYVDSVVNKKTGTSRVRNTFAIVPDAPVTRFELKMKGGKLGLIENSKNLCKQKNRATVKMGAHNGLALTTEPVVKTSCGKKAKKRKK